jgi:hypothetical protein
MLNLKYEPNLNDDDDGFCIGDSDQIASSSKPKFSL